MTVVGKEDELSKVITLLAETAHRKVQFSPLDVS
jgi:hypothetical protein